MFVLAIALTIFGRLHPQSYTELLISKITIKRIDTFYFAQAYEVWEGVEATAVFERSIGMLFVGIDVAKKDYVCTVIEEDGTPLYSNRFFTNDGVGFQSFLEFLNTMDDDKKIGLESTGHYHKNLIQTLVEHGYQPIVLNALQVSKAIEAFSSRHLKTDKSDALNIARLLRIADPKPHSDLLYHTEGLKSLSRARKQVMEERQRILLRIGVVIDQIFPEVQTILSPKRVTFQALFLEYPSLTAIRSASPEDIGHLFKQVSYGRYAYEDAVRIIDLAKASGGHDHTWLSLQLVEQIQMVQYQSRVIQRYEREINTILKELNHPILTIPGISNVLGAMILGELGDIRAFSSPAKIQAFAGLDPSIRESGSSIHAKGRMVKRGSPYLRWALITAAQTVSMYSETFHRYYLKKKKEGKHHYVALSHVARKLIRVLFHLSKTGESFSEQKLC